MNMPPPIFASSVLPWEKKFSLEKSTEVLPGISIVIPIYNSGLFLEKTLRSILCNDLSDIEIILMDGGSTDNTMEIVEHYKSMFTQIHSKKDNGQSDAINKGFEKAKKEIYYWLNGDDIILPNTLNKIRHYFKKHSDCQVLVGNAYMTELDFSPINHFVFSPEKLTFSYLLDYAKNHLIQPSVFFTRKAWELSGPLNISDHYAMDADLFIGMANKFKLHHINIDVAYSVYHENCKTRGARAESIISLALVQAKYNGINEARETLHILASLYKELESQLKKEPSDIKLKAITAKIEAMQAHQEKQKKLLLQMDIEVHS